MARRVSYHVLDFTHGSPLGVCVWRGGKHVKSQQFPGALKPAWCTVALTEPCLLCFSNAVSFDQCPSPRQSLGTPLLTSTSSAFQNTPVGQLRHCLCASSGPDFFRAHFVAASGQILFFFLCLKSAPLCADTATFALFVCPLMGRHLDGFRILVVVDSAGVHTIVHKSQIS